MTIAVPARAYRATACGLAASLLAALAPAQTAPTPPPNAPSAGSLLQQAQPPAVQAPALGQVPELQLPKAVQAPARGGPAVEVKGFRLLGIDEARAAVLLPALQKYVGPGKTLADLEDAAKDVEVALQREGLFLAQVYVPEQKLADGIVALQVLPGRIGAVKVEADPGVKVRPEVLDAIALQLRGHPVAERGLVERALFTLGDLRGIAVQSALTPGDQPGLADLTIRVLPAAASSHVVEFDNGGSIFTGRYRFFYNGEWYNAAGAGDMFSVRSQLSTNGGAFFVRGAYLTPINAYGTKVGIAVSLLKYDLGDSLEALDADGKAGAFSLQLLHPVVRSRNANLFLTANADLRYFDDRVHAVPLRIRKGNSAYATLGAVGDFRDTLAGGAINNYSLALIGGQLDIDTASEYALDQSADGYRSAGGYAKALLSAGRLQVLPNKDYLYLSLTGQWANKNLDSSEKFALGGANGVRAYPAPESPSDLGAIASWEYRRPLRFEWLPAGDWVFNLFGDYGYGELHETPLPSDKRNIRKLMGHGIGLTYGGPGGLLVRGYVAMRGETRAQSDDSKARAYVLISVPLSLFW